MKFQDQGKTRLGFSSLFSQSSQESEGELEISNEVESDEIADELVIVEDNSNSTERAVESPEAVEAGAVLFGTFGKNNQEGDDENVSEKLSDSVEVAEIMDEITEEKKENMEGISPQDNAEHGQDSVESEPDEDPVFYEEEEQEFDLEADFFIPGAKVKKAQTNI